MSAFIVKDSSIHAIVSFLRLNLPEALACEGFALDSDESCGRLGQALRDLNCAAVAERYGTVGSHPYAHENVQAPSTAEAFRRLECLYYQCDEFTTRRLRADLRPLLNGLFRVTREVGWILGDGDERELSELMEECG